MTTLYKKRLEILASIGEVKVSSSGNHYVILKSVENPHQKVISSHNVTINTLNEIHTSKTWVTKIDEIVMLTKDNRLLYKSSMENARFVALGKKVVRNNFNVLKDIYFYNKKCEYLKNYQEQYLDYFSYLKSFNSLKSAFAHLGCYYKEYYNPSNLGKLLSGYRFKNKKSLYNLDESTILDTISMINSLNEKSYYESTKNVLKIHDELSYKLNQKKILSASDKKIVPNWFDEVAEVLENNLIDLKFYTSERDLLCAGIEFKNCIAGKHWYLNSDMFFSYNIKGKTPFIAQVAKGHSNYVVQEAKEKCNKSNSEEVKNLQNILNIIPLKKQSLWQAGTLQEVQD